MSQANAEKDILLLNPTKAKLSHPVFTALEAVFEELYSLIMNKAKIFNNELQSGKHMLKLIASAATKSVKIT